MDDAALVASKGIADATEGFMDIVLARLWNGTFERLLLISESGIQLLDPETSRQSHAWSLAELRSVVQEPGSSVVTCKLSTGWMWQRSPSFSLPSSDRAELLCWNLARHCAARWQITGATGATGSSGAAGQRQQQPSNLPTTPNSSDDHQRWLVGATRQQAALLAQLVHAEAERKALGAIAEEERRLREAVEEAAARERSASGAEQARAAAATEAAKAAAEQEAKAAALAREEARRAKKAEEHAKRMAAEAKAAAAARAESAEADVAAAVEAAMAEEEDAMAAAAVAASEAAASAAAEEVARAQAAAAATERAAATATEEAWALATAESEARAEFEAAAEEAVRAEAAAEAAKEEVMEQVNTLRDALEETREALEEASGEAEAAKAEAARAKAEAAAAKARSVASSPIKGSGASVHEELEELRRQLAKSQSELSDERQARESAVAKVVELMHGQAGSQLEFESHMRHAEQRASEMALHALAKHQKRKSLSAALNVDEARAERTLRDGSACSGSLNGSLAGSRVGSRRASVESANAAGTAELDGAADASRQAGAIALQKGVSAEEVGLRAEAMAVQHAEALEIMSQLASQLDGTRSA